MLDEFFWTEIRPVSMSVFRLSRNIEASLERTGEALTTGVGEGVELEGGKGQINESCVESIHPMILSPKFPMILQH